MLTRGISAILGLLSLCFTLGGATLEKLTFDDMAVKSTAIVRGRVTSTYAAPRGSMIYTHYQMLVTDRWKGSPATQIDVVLPGGLAGGARQHFSGVPTLTVGTEYVLFLWTGPKTGLTQIMGLTQGLFNIKTDAAGNTVVYRATSGEVLLDKATGQPVKDEAIELTLADLNQRIKQALATGAK